jgi:hypothetical protein
MRALAPPMLLLGSAALLALGIATLLAVPERLGDIPVELARNAAEMALVLAAVLALAAAWGHPRAGS